MKVEPKFADLHFSLGWALRAKGEIPEALAEWRSAVQAKPTEANYLYWVAWTLATSDDPSLRNGKEAIDFAQQAVKASGGRDPVMIDALAAAYAEAGQFPRAIEVEAGAGIGRGAGESEDGGDWRPSAAVQGRIADS